jgi:3-deoxy-7-phosphoheptulonate synthase
MQPWSLTSWLQCVYEQAVHYKDVSHLNTVVDQLHVVPPLIPHSEIQQLQTRIAEAGRGEAFLLQGGDCAESFADSRQPIIRKKFNILQQMTDILLTGLGMPVIPIGRIAGQYAKPRSSEYETLDGVQLPCYRGDLINASEFTSIAREPNPDLLLKGYECSANTLRHIRNLTPPGRVFFTSHEALHLHYEQALTRQAEDGRWYNLSTHLPWIGVRTTKLHSAHVELLRGVNNPIGIKIGPDSEICELLAILEQLNPMRENGRILLISRMGAAAINKRLPPMIQAILASGMPVTWSCDPMHGNTRFTQHGIKTRAFETIRLELDRAIAIHQQLGVPLGGVHLELTGDNVTECTGGAQNLTATDLTRAYLSLVDPRLNAEQSLEIATHLSRHWR